ncbi:MAG: dihydropteroate synthase [Anaerolineae bacterium]|jgi:5-methyltetrahydrofolate--homocysteine methyltransferase
METVLKGTEVTVRIGPELPTVIIGEKINPTGRKWLTKKLTEGNLEVLRGEATQQLEDGAAVLDVNVGAASVNEADLLPRAVKIIQDTVDVPLCIDTADKVALEAALKVYQGKPLINSVNGEEKNLKVVLPLVAEYGAAVIGLTMDDDGIPKQARKRLEIAKKIVERAESLGIPREDVLIDCLALTVSAEPDAALITLETIELVRKELGVNQALGHSNVSFGLPDREVINRVALGMVIRAGVNAPIVNAAEAKQSILAADLLLGRDQYAMNYIKYYRAHKQ